MRTSRHRWGGQLPASATLVYVWAHLESPGCGRDTLGQTAVQLHPDLMAIVSSGPSGQLRGHRRLGVGRARWSTEIDGVEAQVPSSALRTEVLAAVSTAYSHTARLSVQHHGQRHRPPVQHRGERPAPPASGQQHPAETLLRTAREIPTAFAIPDYPPCFPHLQSPPLPHHSL